MNKLMRGGLLLLSLSTLIFSSCDNSLFFPEENTSDKETTIHKLTFSLSYENSMYQKTKGSLADVFDEFYEKIITGELVAETYDIIFQEVESGATYSFSGAWKDATVELQAATYKVTGTSTAVGERSQSKCSILFDETITITNEQKDIILNARYDCFLFVMTSENLNKVDNCFLFNNKYWYAFVNNKFVDTLTGSHKDGTNFSVKMDDYKFSKGKYYVYDDVSINEYSVYYLISKMENGLEGESNAESEEHEYVDLGLPSGTLWATCNIGANNPEEYGDYFGWGEIAPSEHYGWNYYKFGNNYGFTKYNTNDGLTQLELEDDAAYVNWGDSWRMPTHDEEVELSTYCNIEPLTINNVDGYKFIGPNGNFIFFPLGGLVDPTDYSSPDDEPVRMGEGGWYWSSTMNSVGGSYASGFCFWPSLMLSVCDHERCDGHMIRPVKRQ